MPRLSGVAHTGRAGESVGRGMWALDGEAQDLGPGASPAGASPSPHMAGLAATALSMQPHLRTPLRECRQILPKA